jgi:hypothetical protein
MKVNIRLRLQNERVCIYIQNTSFPVKKQISMPTQSLYLSCSFVVARVSLPAAATEQKYTFKKYGVSICF